MALGLLEPVCSSAKWTLVLAGRDILVPSPVPGDNIPGTTVLSCGTCLLGPDLVSNHEY